MLLLQNNNIVLRDKNMKTKINLERVSKRKFSHDYKEDIAEKERSKTAIKNKKRHRQNEKTHCRYNVYRCMYGRPYNSTVSAA
jgi:hypothetical protein